VAAPFLGSLGQRRATAQAEVSPKRLIVMFTHYGCITTRFFPTRSHGALSAGDLASTTLAPLAPYVGKLLMPRGIRAMNEWTMDLSRGQGNDPYTQVVGSYFTCQPVSPNSDDPFSFNTETKFNAMPLGPSLDHVIAQQLSADGTPLYLRLGNRNESPSTGISYSASQTPYAGVGLPSQVLSELTGLFVDGPPSPDSHAVARGKSILDVVKADLETFERLDMSASDKLKLAAWKELLHSTGTVMASAQCKQEVAVALGATEEDVAAFGAQTAADTLSTKLDGTMLDGADLYSNVAALAAVCHANPVIVLKYPAGHIFSGLGIDHDHAGLSHRTGSGSLSGSCVAGVLDLLARIDAFHAQKFARLVGLLDGIDEGDGTVLDNSAAVWFQQMSDGYAFNLNNLPIVQVGSAGGYFKTGGAVNVDDGSAELTRGNSEYYCSREGDLVGPMEQLTGTPPELANAPINKYFVNLMNALGVRGGADGFPAKDGQGEVTHFGRYDRTEDFIGGGIHPPMIHSPGGFDALRAGS
jgi:hypothetical protein